MCKPQIIVVYLITLNQRALNYKKKKTNNISFIMTKYSRLFIKYKHNNIKY